MHFYKSFRFSIILTTQQKDPLEEVTKTIEDLKNQVDKDPTPKNSKVTFTCESPDVPSTKPHNDKVVEEIMNSTIQAIQERGNIKDAMLIIVKKYRLRSMKCFDHDAIFELILER